MKKVSHTVTLLQIQTEQDYQKNLTALLDHIHKVKESHLIIAPEVCLTGFDYENFDKAAAFFEIAIDVISAQISDQIMVLTLIKKEGENFVNQAVVIHNNKIIHQQNKYKLFTVGDETKYFRKGEPSGIVPFEINGIRYGILICFELRFKALWKQLEGVDIVLSPSLWGKPRKKHLEVLSQALAIMNQSFVLVCNSANEDMAKSSAIISPWGEVIMNDTVENITHTIDLKEIKRVRRLVPMR